MAEAYTVRKNDIRVPLLAHIPHSSTRIPPEIRPAIWLDDVELERELLALTDRYTDELFSAVHRAGGLAVVYTCSRLVVDPERFADDEKEVMATAGMGVIYTRTSTGAVLRAKPTTEEREGLLRRFYWPYHRALEREIDELIAAFGRCLILDCHSFPSHPLPCELDQDPNRPDICIGTDEAHTPETLTRTIETFFASRGLATARDRPYRGAYVPLKHWQVDSRVSAVMIEVNRKLYMHEETGVKAGSFSAVKSMIADLVSCILSTSGNVFHGGED